MHDDSLLLRTFEFSSSLQHIGDRIGPHKIREAIGVSDRGTVYVAEQARPLRRKVALKVIKPGMGPDWPQWPLSDEIAVGDENVD